MQKQLYQKHKHQQQRTPVKQERDTPGTSRKYPVVIDEGLDSVDDEEEYEEESDDDDESGVMILDDGGWVPVSGFMGWRSLHVF